MKGAMLFLLTRAATVLYFDQESGNLRQMPPDRVPRNLVFVPASVGSAGRLAVLNESGAPTDLGRDVLWLALPDGQLGLHLGAPGASALDDTGALDVFWPLTAAQLEGLAFLLRHRWVSQSCSAAAPAPVRAVLTGDGLAVGSALYPFTALREALAHITERRAFTVADGTWRLERFRLYRPLVTFTAFGAEAVFDCLTLAIQALDEFGGWEDDILVLTDAAHVEFAQRFDDPLRSRIRTQIITCQDVLDYTLARYLLPSVPGIEHYQPVLYLDVDVLCDRSIEPVMLGLLATEGLSVGAEHALTTNGHWYGASLLLEDGYVPEPGERGFSTGIMGFRDVAQVRDAFALILASCLTYAQASGERDRFDTYDQPFANYVLRKLGGFDTASLTPLSAIHEPGTPPDPATARGFAHFAGGVGKAVPKLERMQIYLTALRAPP